MYLEFTKHNIWINSNGTQKDNDKVVMFKRVLIDQCDLKDGSCLETNKNGKGICLNVSEYSTIEELKEYARVAKEYIKDKNIKPSDQDVMMARECEQQIDLTY